jgi:hypothetical protein
MVESVASTSSSSNSGSTSNESHRESQDPNSVLSAPGDTGSSGGASGGGHYRHHRLSRSSAEGDDDSSDPCSSIPYLPLEHWAEEHELPMAPSPGVVSVGGEGSFTRRHSLPLSETRSARLMLASRTSSEESAEGDTSYPSHLQQQPSLHQLSYTSSTSLHRQYSLVERRRYNVLRHQQSDPAMPHTYRLSTHKRRMFAAQTSRSAVSDTAAAMTPDIARTMKDVEGGHHDDEEEEEMEMRKVFRMTVSPAIGDEFRDEEGDDEDKENTLLLSEPRFRNRNQTRRGSAPCSLLLGIRHAWSPLQSKSPTSPTSRELSPTTLKQHANNNSSNASLMQRLSLFNSQRRGSLPAEQCKMGLFQDVQQQLQQQQQQQQGQRSSSCGREQQPQQPNKKQKSSNRGFRTARRQSGGTELLRIASSSSSPHRLNEIGSCNNSSNNNINNQTVTSASSSGRARRGTFRRHHSHGQQQQQQQRRGSVPVAVMCVGDMIIDSLMPIEQNRKAATTKQQLELLRAQVSEQLMEDVKSSLALLNGRRGSLPSDLTMANFVK